MFDTFTKKCTRNYTAAYTIEPMVQIQNNFTELFLMLPSTKLHKWFRSAEQKDLMFSIINKYYIP